MALSKSVLASVGGRVHCDMNAKTGYVAEVFKKIVEEEMTNFKINEKAQDLTSSFQKIGHLLALTNEEKCLREEADAKDMAEEKVFIFQPLTGQLTSESLMAILFRKIYTTLAVEHGEEEAKTKIFSEDYIVGAHFPCTDGTLSMYVAVSWMLLFGVPLANIDTQSWTHTTTRNRIQVSSEETIAWVFALDIGATADEKWKQVRGLFTGDHHEGPNQQKIRESGKKAIEAGCLVVDFSQYISTAATEKADGDVNAQKIPTGFSVAMTATRGLGTCFSEAAAHLAWKADQFLHKGPGDELLALFQLHVPVNSKMKQCFEEMYKFYHDTADQSQLAKFQAAFPEIQESFAKSLRVGAEYLQNAALVDYNADENIGLVFTSLLPGMVRNPNVDATVIVPLFNKINERLSACQGENPKFVWVSFERSWNGSLSLSIKRSNSLSLSIKCSNLAEENVFHDCSAVAKELETSDVMQAYLLIGKEGEAYAVPSGGGHDFAAGLANVPADIYDAVIMRTLITSVKAYRTPSSEACGLWDSKLQAPNVDDKGFDFDLGACSCYPCREFPVFKKLKCA